MEKAKLTVREGKKKKIIAELQFQDGKEMPVSRWTPEDLALNGAEVEVERRAGQVVLIKSGDSVLFHAGAAGGTLEPKPGAAPVSAALQFDHISHVDNPAYAPYNFVPLNHHVLETDPPPKENRYCTETEGKKRHTGWVGIEIEALTPLYIRGTLTNDDIEAGTESKKKLDFFAPAGKIRIPGSSLRGLVRNMVEIVSFGKFHFFEDRRLYYRGLADRSNLRADYQSRMSSYDTKTKSSTYKMSAGYLVRREGRYGIIPAQTRSGRQFDRIRKEETKRLLNSAKKFSYENYEFFEHEGMCIVISGDMPKKKHDWLIYPRGSSENTIWLDDNNDDNGSDIENYYFDRNRNAVNLTQELEKNGDLELPCFYVQWIDGKERKRVSFGHTAMFRLAYEKTVGEHLPEEFKDQDKIDFTEAIFGNEKTFCGRVFFEDAFLLDANGRPKSEIAVRPQILSSPKPTTFQHYLVQKSEQVKELDHYNDNSALRGYKLYWHKSGDTERWVETDQERIDKSPDQYTKIRPVNQGATFHGRIRFENLSTEELGALLFALDLPTGCGHKLGMGKPLGLGSVRITPVLYISDRSMRYRDFFAEWNNEIAPAADSLLEGMKITFEKHVLQELGESSKESLWETDRLRELLLMLHIGVGRNLELNGITRYMTISGQNEFKDRPVLPRASDLVDEKLASEAISNVQDVGRSRR